MRMSPKLQHAKSGKRARGQRNVHEYATAACKAGRYIPLNWKKKTGTTAGAPKINDKPILAEVVMLRSITPGAAANPQTETVNLSRKVKVYLSLPVVSCLKMKIHLDTNIPLRRAS